MAPLGSSELPGQIVALVRGKLRAAPVLRTKWALLARDLLALLTGLRTGVMLDYAAMQPAVLLELVDGVAQLAVMGRQLAVAQWEGCCYVLRRDLLAKRAADKHAVLWLKLAWEGEQRQMCRASPQEVEEVCRQVDSCMQMLHVARTANGVFDLSLVEGEFIIPTLNGWLLGYPVVYLVTSGTVEGTADYLSLQDLQRHVLKASCPGLKAACVQAGLSNPSALRKLQDLLSFTVPDGLLGVGLPCREVQALEDQWCAKLCGELDLWEISEVSYEVGKQRVQL